MDAPRMGTLRRGCASAVALALALAGCAIGTPPEPKELAAQAMPQVKAPEAWRTPGATAGAVADGWVATLADPALEALIGEALAFNPDIRVAAARVERAAALARQAGSTLYPQVTAIARGGGAMSGDSSGLEGGALAVNWELDLWGRVRSQAAAGSSQYEASQLDLEYARQSIAALVARSWFLATEARRQRAIAQEMEAAAARLVELARERARVGKGDELDVRLAQATRQSYRDAVLQLELAETQALRAIEELAGRYPDATLQARADFPAFPGPVPAGLPSELLERRLDVRAAERRVASAFYLVGEAEAARLPRISLTASVNSVSSELFFMKERDNPVWSAGAGITAPIFLGGALQANVEMRTAEQKAAVADYARVGARAFAEVENALSSGFSLAERVRVLEAAVAENARALELVQVRYRVGTADLRAVQQQMLALAAARATLTRATAERLAQRVNLHLALGGGFGQAAPAQSAAR